MPIITAGFEKGSAPPSHSEEDDAAGKHVDFVGGEGDFVGFPGEDFRGAVAWGAGGAVGEDWGTGVGVPEDTGDAKVDDFYFLFRRHQNISRLEVAVRLPDVPGGLELFV